MKKDIEFINVYIPDGFDSLDFMKIGQKILSHFEWLFKNGELNFCASSKYSINTVLDMSCLTEEYNLCKFFVLCFACHDNTMLRISYNSFEFMKEEIEESRDCEYWFHYDDFLKMKDFKFIIESDKMDLL